MKCLQSGERKCLYRGVQGDVVSEAGEKNMYERDKRFVWWSFSSTTAVIESVKHYFGGEGKQTIFQIDSSKGADVSGFSVYGSDEAELLLPPGTVLCSLGVMKSGNTTIIQCEDDESAPQLVF